MTSNRRILLITRNLPPLVGGMERLNWHMADELSRHAEVRVIAPVGSAIHAPRNVTIIEVPLAPLWKFLAHATYRAILESRRWRPMWVLAGSGLTALATLLAARASGARAAAYVHGLDLAIRHPIYKRVWLPAFRRLDRIIANSQPTRNLAIDIGVARGALSIVHPGVCLPELLPDPIAIAQFRKSNHLGDRPLLISVGRLSERKGLREFVSEALPQIVAAHPDVILLIVGDAPSQALHAKAQTPSSIQEVADAAGVGRNLRFLGVVTDYGELGRAYCAASVHVFPVREIPNDPEGFGMVAIEAAAHGLPTVAFASGGVVDAVKEGISGRLVESGNYIKLADAIIAELAKPNDEKLAHVRGFARQFAWEVFGERMRTSLDLDL